MGQEEIEPSFARSVREVPGRPASCSLAGLCRKPPAGRRPVAAAAGAHAAPASGARQNRPSPRSKGARLFGDPPAARAGPLLAPDPTVDWTFRPLLDTASTVRFAETALRFDDLARYSQRQDRHVQLGGYTGTLDLEGDLAPLAPLLLAAEVTHLGKGAVFGLGQIALANG